MVLVAFLDQRKGDAGSPPNVGLFSFSWLGSSCNGLAWFCVRFMRSCFDRCLSGGANDAEIPGLSMLLAYWQF